MLDLVHRGMFEPRSLQFCFQQTPGTESPSPELDKQTMGVGRRGMTDSVRNYALSPFLTVLSMPRLIYSQAAFPSLSFPCLFILSLPCLTWPSLPLHSFRLPSF